MKVRGGVIEAGDVGQVAWLGVVVTEELGATVAAIKVLVDEAGGGADAVGAADEGVVAIVAFGVYQGQVRGCLGRSAQ